VVEKSLTVDSAREAAEFDYTFFIDRMLEVQTKNVFMAMSLQQKLSRYSLKPSEDRVSPYLRPLLGVDVCDPVESDCSTVPYNEKLERTLVDELKSKTAVNHEKLRRQIASMLRETEASRNLLLMKEEEKSEMTIHMKDVKCEALSHYAELEIQQKRLKKWKICYEKVFRRLMDMQASFQDEPISETHAERSLDGMRRNINRLLSENRRLTQQVSEMNEQLRLYDSKLRGVRHETKRSLSLLHAQREEAAANALASSTSIGESSLLGGSMTPRVRVGFVPPEGPYSLSEWSRGVEWFYEETAKDPSNGALAANAYLRAIADPSQPTGQQILDSAGHEFYIQWKQAQLLYGVSEALQHMASIRDLDKAVSFVMQAICRLCECDRASYWVIDQTRGIAWTKVASNPSQEDRRQSTVVDDKPPVSMTTLMIPLSTGLVGAAFRSGQVLNIADAYADNRFNRTVDQKTEYRTKSVLCFPVVLRQQIVGIVQCINKVSPSNSVFSESDIAVVKTLGSAMLGVLSSCHAHEESRKLSMRRQVLVDTTDDLVRRMTCRRHFLVILREKMKQLFRADECALVLVYRDFVARVALDFDQTLTLVSSDRGALAPGLVHKCLASHSPIHVFGRSDLATIGSCPADLGIIRHLTTEASGPPDGDVSVHSWPLISVHRPGEISAIIQWACLDRSVIGFGDDGSFNEKNSVHVDLCSRFMKLIEYYVEKFWPSKFRLTWTKVKHFQLKVRGMLSFSPTNDESRDPAFNHRKSTPFANRNMRVVSLWKKAKEFVVNHKRKTDPQPTVTVKKPTMQCVDEFKAKLVRERTSSLVKRPTIRITQSSMEELRSIAEGRGSPFHRKIVYGNSVFGNSVAPLGQEDSGRSNKPIYEAQHQTGEASEAPSSVLSDIQSSEE
jgi:hypothetical protein